MPDVFKKGVSQDKKDLNSKIQLKWQNSRDELVEGLNETLKDKIINELNTM